MIKKMAADYDGLTKQVLNLYPQIKFVGVVNVKGEIISGGHKENVEQLLIGDEVKMSIHYALQKRDLYTNLAYKIGKERSAVSEFEKAAIISIPINSNELFLVRTDKGINYLEIVDFVYSKLDPKKYVREEIKWIQSEIEKLKKINESIETKSEKDTVKSKPAGKTKGAKSKPAGKTKGAKSKPAGKTVKSERKNIKQRRP